MYQYVMLGETNERTAGFEDLNTRELTIFAILIIGIFAMGVYPKPFMQLVQPSLETILSYSMR
jgi:NADH-quinone oxidoreductase subunit M